MEGSVNTLIDDLLWPTTEVTRALAAVAGIAVLYVGGLAQHTILTGNVGTAALLGVVPFAAADLVKALIAAAVSGRRGGLPS
jgi:biotin transporter BioY